MSLTAKQRAAIVKFNVSHDGWGNGSSYPGKSPNPACQHFHVGTTYSCAYGVSYAFDEIGPRLVSMQPGMSTGYAYCPSGLDKARALHAVIDSWETKPADIIFVNTGSGAQPGHTEMVVSWHDGVLTTFGWDSGPSNVDRYTGQGGCHLHHWTCPKGVGNADIIAAADASKLVVSTGSAVKTTPTVTPAAHKKAAKHGPKGTPLNKDTTSKVVTVTTRLTRRTKAVKAGSGDRKRLEQLRAAITADLNRKATP